MFLENLTRVTCILHEEVCSFFIISCSFLLKMRSVSDKVVEKIKTHIYYYIFRPVVAIIRFYHSTHLRLFYTIRVAACLMRRSQHQNPWWSILPLYIGTVLQIILHNSRGGVFDEEISISKSLLEHSTSIPTRIV